MGRSKKSSAVSQMSLKRKLVKKQMQKYTGPQPLAELYTDVMERIESRCRLAEFKNHNEIQRIQSDVELIQANQVVTQTMLAKKGILDVNKFHEEFEYYCVNFLGVVDKNGRMNGSVVIDMYNVGKAREPSSGTGDFNGSPVIVM